MNIKAKRLLPVSCKIFLGLFSPAINLRMFKKKTPRMLTPPHMQKINQNFPTFCNNKDKKVLP
jgi:hypothetical protein